MGSSLTSAAAASPLVRGAVSRRPARRRRRRRGRRRPAALAFALPRGGGAVPPSRALRVFRAAPAAGPRAAAGRRRRARVASTNLRRVPREATSGWRSKASVGVERRRARGSKARGPGRRETPGKVLKDRRAPRERGRMGTGVRRTRLMRREDALAVRGVEVGYARGSVPPGHGPQRARRRRLRVVRRRRSRGVGGACARAVPAGEVVRVPPRRHLRRAARERLCAQDARARRGRDARSAVARRRRWARRDLTRVNDARRLAVGSRAVGSARARRGRSSTAAATQLAAKDTYFFARVHRPSRSRRVLRARDRRAADAGARRASDDPRAGRSSRRARRDARGDRRRRASGSARPASRERRRRRRRRR